MFAGRKRYENISRLVDILGFGRCFYQPKVGIEMGSVEKVIPALVVLAVGVISLST
jgi:hypothetical protein